MLMVCHHLSPKVPEDVAFADSRIRPETIAAEDVLHDLGAISMMSSDSQAMGRIGEVICRTWQTADKMKRQRGPLPGDARGDDNLRVRRYIAKYTINPAIAHGIAHRGRLDRGRQAGRSGAVEAGVLRRQARAGHQGRLHRRRDDGRRQRLDSDAAAGASRGRCSARFGAALRRVQRALRQRRPASTAARWPGWRGRWSPSAAAARIGKRDLVLNDALPKIEVNAGHLRSARRRRAADLRAGERAAAGAAILSLLSGRRELPDRDVVTVVERVHSRRSICPTAGAAVRARRGDARLGRAH